MASNEQSIVYFESGVTSFPMQALTDSGDHINFTSSAVLFSQADGNEPVVRPNGVVNGGKITPSAATNSVDVASVLLNLAGVETSVNANSVTIARPASNVSKVISITVNSAGALAAVGGTDGTSTAFSEVRGAAGAPPFIPVGSVELGQVRLTSTTTGVILASEIFQIDGTHKETADFPVFDILDEVGNIKFSAALPLIHTGGLPKGVFASFAEPVFIEQPFANDFVPAEESTSVSSTQVYGATVGTSSKSLSGATFTAILKNGITDPIISKKGQNLWFKYVQDRTKLPHILTQGRVSFGRTFNASDNPKVTVTIAASQASIEKAS
jgi:hypothetical protein